MPDLALDLRQLKYAMLVAEHGSFRRAADAVNLSQSTITRRIQLLERRLGVPLFERSRSGTRLTYAGERFMFDAAVGARHLYDAVITQHSHTRVIRVRRLGPSAIVSETLCRNTASRSLPSLRLFLISSQS
jgi:DNA-binding transcriptional LysR family regulator